MMWTPVTGFAVALTFIAACENLLAASPATQTSAGPPPNIVFIYADDWGWGDLSCHGHPFLKTPNIDRLATEGTDFLQFNVLNPVCSPSRAAALTGRYPSRFSINSVFNEQGNEASMPDWLDPRAPTIPRLLRSAGYRTGHFGKWHLGSGNLAGAPRMADYGIDDSAVYHGPGPAVGVHEIADKAAAFIAQSKDRPFYVDVWLHESHLAHDPTPASLKKWEALDEQKRVYAAVISDGDDAVGKVLGALDHAGVADRTLVCFSSDNGPESTGTAKDKGTLGKFGSYYSIGDTHGLRGRKRSLFEGGVRTPFIVRWPGHTPAGVKNDVTVLSAVDLLPTFCAAAGVAVPDDAKGDGQSLLDALNGNPRVRSRPIFWLHTGKNAEPDWWPRLAVRDGDWKLVTTFDGSRAELFNVVHDRTEAVNVAKEHPELTKQLTESALQWYKSLPSGPDPSCVSTGRSTAGRRPPKTNSITAAGPGGGTGADTVGGSNANPATRPTPDRVKAFARWDVNQDGVLTFDEYKAGLGDKPNLEKRFKNFDSDGDGKLTRREFVGND